MTEIKETINKIKSKSDLVTVLNYYGIHLNKGNKACCPFHNEKTASFIVKEDGDKAVYHCFGCGEHGDIINFIRKKENVSTLEAIRKAYDILGFNLDMQPNKLDKLKDYIEKKIKLDGYYIESMYPYMLDENTPSFIKVKYRSLTDKSKKDMRTYKVIDTGEYYRLGTKAKDGDYDYTIYNYPKVKEAINKGNNIYFVEGEKDADNLNRLGLTATTIYAKTNDKKIWDKYKIQLQNAKIVFIGDTGKAGEEFKQLIWGHLKDNVRAFKVVNLPNLELLGDNKDVTDWLEAGHTKEELIEAIRDSHDLLKDELYKYLDERVDNKGNIKYSPQKIWENLECLLKAKHITVKYNELSKAIDIEGVAKDIGENSQLYDIHSLCHKNRLKLNINDIQNFTERISKKNKYNPVKEYLKECFDSWDGTDRVKDLCNTLITTEHYNDEHKELFVTKWLINTVRICFNDGSYGCEGILVIQGPQGIGKTRWIKSIVPNLNWVKTGLEVDPSDKDKIRLATKYWISELGEMDSTLKRDQAKLKAFFTEAKDEYRKAYARVEEYYPRLTSFYATVNDEEFLKDPTGNRRYWVIPVEKINVDHNIDLDQLWGEVMHLWKVKKIPHYLTEDDYKILNENNAHFEVKDEVYIKVAEGFDWDVEEGYWFGMRATEIADYLGIRNMTSLGNTLKKFNLEKNRTKKGYVYIVPPFKKKEDLSSPFVDEIGNKRASKYKKAYK